MSASGPLASGPYDPSYERCPDCGLLASHPDWTPVPAVAAHRRHLAHLLVAAADGLFARVKVAEAEVSAAAAALAVGLVLAVGNAAGAGLVLRRDNRPVLDVREEIVPLGDAVLSGADFFALIANLTVGAAKGTAAVDAEADRGFLAT